MCTLYRLRQRDAELADLFGAALGPPAPAQPVDEIYPKRGAYVVCNAPKRRLDIMQWGFPPPPTSKAPVVNVRNLTSPFWRSALVNPERRCLVPVSQFCEWEGEKGAKVKRWFSVPSQPVFAFAGIWRQTETGQVFAFLTCAPNPLVGAVHPKAMPVILHTEDYDRWLKCDYDEACSLAVAFPSQLMAMNCSLDLTRSARTTLGGRI